MFSASVWTQLSFANVSVLQACSIFFSSDPLDGVPEDFTVDILVDGVPYHTETYAGNTQSAVKISGFTVYTPDAIKVTVTKWSLPYRRMRTVEIVPGYYEQWSENMLASFSVQQQGDVSCLTLPYGMLKMAMNNKNRMFEPRSKSGLFQSIEERQGVETYIGVRLADGSVEYKRVGVFYQYSDGWKTGDNGLTMQWDLVDIIGLLADRAYLAPTVLPITLSGWIASLVAQLGTNFADRYTVDADYSNLAVTASSRAAVSGKKCGDILRWACMATGTWPRADAETGKLAVEPLWNQGSKITLENLVNYPTMKANQSLASLIFHLSDGTEYVVSGNSTSSEKTMTIENPLLHTQAQALTAARLILSCYGGNQLELTGRGDPSSEIGDVDTVWLDESSATTARRIYQTFQFSDGVLQGCQSKLLQADGSYLYTERAVFTESGSWTAPAGKAATARMVRTEILTARARTAWTASAALCGRTPFRSTSSRPLPSPSARLPPSASTPPPTGSAIRTATRTSKAATASPAQAWPCPNRAQATAARVAGAATRASGTRKSNTTRTEAPRVAGGS